MKPKFKVGQVVHIAFMTSADAYGVVTGFDDGRWHVKIREYEHKIMETQLRALTAKEMGR